ncbi:type 2 periplasmic-binding domain-containing protein [Herminiimonas contaminans]|uniref:substrate-binding domain-containing protein n=1 Tax=Herminiimonas contaminans TaxID=1111140 RepID=UPI001E3DA29D|nr:substrate-binding domain-containing protein [Herminiimonas contaminans]
MGHNWIGATESGDDDAIGYFGYAYYVENSKKLNAVAISERAGAPAVSPSSKSVLNASYKPLSRPLFIYVSAKAVVKPEVKEFVEFYLKNGEKMVKEAKYIPLNRSG